MNGVGLRMVRAKYVGNGELRCDDCMGKLHEWGAEEQSRACDIYIDAEGLRWRKRVLLFGFHCEAK